MSVKDIKLFANFLFISLFPLIQISTIIPTITPLLYTGKVPNLKLVFHNFRSSYFCLIINQTRYSGINNMAESLFLLRGANFSAEKFPANYTTIPIFRTTMRHFDNLTSAQKYENACNYFTCHLSNTPTTKKLVTHMLLRLQINYSQDPLSHARSGEKYNPILETLRRVLFFDKEAVLSQNNNDPSFERLLACHTCDSDQQIDLSDIYNINLQIFIKKRAKNDRKSHNDQNFALDKLDQGVRREPRYLYKKAIGIIPLKAFDFFTTKSSRATAAFKDSTLPIHNTDFHKLTITSGQFRDTTTPVHITRPRRTTKKNGKKRKGKHKLQQTWDYSLRPRIKILNRTNDSNADRDVLIKTIDHEENVSKYPFATNTTKWLYSYTTLQPYSPSISKLINYTAAPSKKLKGGKSLKKKFGWQNNASKLEISTLSTNLFPKIPLNNGTEHPINVSDQFPITARAGINSSEFWKLNLSSIGLNLMSPNLTLTHSSGSSEGGLAYWATLLLVVPILTIFGNVLVILSIYRERSLHTVTNYFIISLACADILVSALVMPFAVYIEVTKGLWELGEIACDFFIASDVCMSTASILNLVAISVDRFIAVTQPIKYSKHSNSKRIPFTIGLCWIVSAAIASPVLLGLNNTADRDTSICTFFNADFILYSSLSSFYIPCLIMICLYTKIFRVLKARALKAHNKMSKAQITASIPIPVIPSVINETESANRKSATFQVNTNDVINMPLVAHLNSNRNAKGGHGVFNKLIKHLSSHKLRIVSIFGRDNPSDFIVSQVEAVTDFRRSTCMSSNNPIDGLAAPIPSPQKSRYRRKKITGKKSKYLIGIWQRKRDSSVKQSQTLSILQTFDPAHHHKFYPNFMNFIDRKYAPNSSPTPKECVIIENNYRYLKESNNSLIIGEKLRSHYDSLERFSGISEIYNANVIKDTVIINESFDGPTENIITPEPVNQVPNLWLKVQPTIEVEGCSHTDCSDNVQATFNDRNDILASPIFHCQPLNKNTIETNDNQGGIDGLHEIPHAQSEHLEYYISLPHGSPNSRHDTKNPKITSCDLDVDIDAITAQKALNGIRHQKQYSTFNSREENKVAPFHKLSTHSHITLQSEDSLVYNFNLGEKIGKLFVSIKNRFVHNHIDNSDIGHNMASSSSNYDSKGGANMAESRDPNKYSPEPEGLALKCSTRDSKLVAKVFRTSILSTSDATTHRKHKAETYNQTKRHYSEDSSNQDGYTVTLKEKNKAFCNPHHDKKRFDRKTIADIESSHFGDFQATYMSKFIKKRNSKRKRDKMARKEKKATQTLAIVLMVFLICWVPFFTVNLLNAICQKLNHDPCKPSIFAFTLTTWIGYMNSLINPAIYTIFNMEFRKAFKKILCAPSVAH